MKFFFRKPSKPVEQKPYDQLLLEQEVQLLLNERMVLHEKINEINQRLTEIGHQAQQVGISKYEICSNWLKLNPDAKRSDFFLEFSQLATRAGLASYYQRFKHKNNTIGFGQSNYWSLSTDDE